MVRNFKLGLIGFPIDHSLSPLLHETMLKATDIAGFYECYPIHPDRNPEVDLEKWIGKIRMGHLHGLNVTTP